MTSYEALSRMTADRRAKLLADADFRRLAGRRPASRRARATASRTQPFSPKVATACQ